MSRQDRKRAKKGSHKLSPQQVEWIRDQKALGLSTRETAKLFRLRYHYIHKISPSTVHRIWKKELHKETRCRLCNAKKGIPKMGGVPFSVLPDVCDPCHKVLEQTRVNAKKRLSDSALRQRLIKEVGEDPDLELIDLPHYIRKKIYEDDNILLEKEDLLRTSPKNKRLRTTGKYPDPATKEVKYWIGAVYAIHFVGIPELEECVYVGQTQSGVLSRFASHITDAKNPERASSGTRYFQKTLTELDRTGKFSSAIRIQLLSNVLYDNENAEEEYKFTSEKEKTSYLELEEQQWQMRLFLSGYKLLNASFKVPTWHPALQAVLHRQMKEWLANPQHHDITDLSSIGCGYYTLERNESGKYARDAWRFYCFVDDTGDAVLLEETLEELRNAKEDTTQ